MSAVMWQDMWRTAHLSGQIGCASAAADQCPSENNAFAQVGRGIVRNGAMLPRSGAATARALFLITLVFAWGCDESPEDVPDTKGFDTCVYATQSTDPILLEMEKEVRLKVQDGFNDVGISMGFIPQSVPAPSPTVFFFSDCDTFVEWDDTEYSESRCNGEPHMMEKYITEYRNDYLSPQDRDLLLVLYVGPSKVTTALGETFQSGSDQQYYNASYLWADRFDSLVVNRPATFRNEDKKFALQANMQHELGHQIAGLAHVDPQQDQFAHNGAVFDNRQHNLSYPRTCYMKIDWANPSDFSASFRFCRANSQRPDTFNTCYWKLRRHYDIWYEIPIEE